jgi:hypothetical protein
MSHLSGAVCRACPTRGYSDADIAAIAGGNVLRVMESAESVARELQETRDAADLLIEAASGD